MTSDNLTALVAWGWFEISRRIENKKLSDARRYAANPEKSLSANTRWRQNNPEKEKARRAKWLETNAEKNRKFSRQWHAKNKARVVARHVKRFQERYATDPIFKAVHLCRNRIRGALKGVATKSSTTLNLIDCSVNALKEHLEKQFRPGMTWENYGQWHVDHIRACANFDLTNPSEQRECFNWKNLQPLWAKENLVKGAR